MPPLLNEERIQRRINLLGAVTLVTCLAQVALSWMLVTGDPGVRIGVGPVSHPRIFLLAYWSPLVVTTVSFFLLLRLLASHRRQLTRATVRLLSGWAIWFAAAGVPATPIMTPDLWLSAGWGRMVAQGMNPYYQSMTPAIESGLPFGHYDGRMTYGPLWALLSGAVMFLAGGNALLGGLFFKLILVSAWIGALRAVMLLLQEHSLWRQAAGAAIFGWLPLGYTQAVMEGHNDIVMVFPMLMWLLRLKEDSHWPGGLWLAASCLTKYATAPLFALDALFSHVSSRESWKQFLARSGVAGLVMAAVLAVFYRSPAFFGAASRMRYWHFFEPSLVADLFSFALKDNTYYLGSLIRLSFPAMAAAAMIGYYRRPSMSRFHRAALFVMAAVVYSQVGHVWPWFLVWLLGLMALIPDSRLSLWSLGVAVVSPFAMVTAGRVWQWDYPLALNCLLFLLPLCCIWLLPGRLTPLPETASSAPPGY